MNIEQQKIDPEEFYSVKKIIDLQLLPWVKHASTLKKILKTTDGQELYMPQIRKAGRFTFYKIKGSTLLHLIQQYGGI